MSWLAGKRIYVAGHRGLAGSAIVRELQARALGPVITRTHTEVDLEDAAQTHALFEAERPQVVFLAAAKVGGILANDTYPADFLIRNLAIELNVMRAAHATGVERLIFLGSSCIYPRDCPQPIREEYLLTGPLEPTNRPYALAKIAGVEMCWAFNRQHGTRYLAAMPTNLYGPGDNYHPTDSHVIPGLVRRFHEAKLAGAERVEVWGTGNPRREFLHVDDMAEACVFCMQHYDEAEIVNVGVGQDMSVREIAQHVKEVVGFPGELVFNANMPDGTPRKLLDVSRLNALGWKARIDFRQGLEESYRWFLENVASGA